MTGRDRTVVVVVLVVVAFVACWLAVVQPKRSQAGKLATQVTAAQSKLNSARQQVAADEAARTAFPTSYSTLVRLGEAVPTDDDTPSLIFELSSAASASHVNFQSLTFDAGAGSSTTSSSSTSTSTASLPPGVTVGAGGFPVEPFTFTFTGSFFQLANFFGRLQGFVVANDKQLSVSGRLMTLNSISLSPNSGGFPQISATVNATTFLLPASQGLLDGATPTGPSPAATQTVSTSSTSPVAPAAAITAPVVR